MFECPSARRESERESCYPYCAKEQVVRAPSLPERRGLAFELESHQNTKRRRRALDNGSKYKDNKSQHCSCSGSARLFCAAICGFLLSYGARLKGLPPYPCILVSWLPFCFLPLAAST